MKDPWPINQKKESAKIKTMWNEQGNMIIDIKEFQDTVREY